jgi:ADP-ribose pyrophosphatase YjhB (NUDIX family)
VESHESLGDALRRKIWEATALTERRYDPSGTFSDPSRIILYRYEATMRVIALAYSVEIENFGTLRCSAESTEMRFFSREELVALDVVETHRHIVDSLLSLAPGVSIILE